MQVKNMAEKDLINLTNVNMLPFACNPFEYTHYQLSTLKMHMKKHSGVKDDICNLCEYATAQPSSLMHHMKTIHTG